MNVKKGLLIISFLLIIIGLAIKINIKYNNYLINYNIKKDVNNFIKHNKTTVNNIIAVLEIPKISLRQGIIKNNNVDEGIEIINDNSFFNKNVILAAHSGNCKVCYFNKLDSLNIGDEINFYYDNYKYIYQITNIELKMKNSFKIDNLEDTITLITCKKNSDNLQIIITGKLINKEKY